MVNHIQTLLLNESAVLVESGLPVSEYGYIDPSFVPVTPDNNILEVYSFLFPSSISASLSSKMSRVKELLPYFNSPEFRSLAGLFDSRVTSGDKQPSSVFDFYVSMSRTDESGLAGAVFIDSAPNAFLKTGDSMLDKMLPVAKEVYASSAETVKRFIALLFAVVIHLEAARRRTLA